MNKTVRKTLDDIEAIIGEEINEKTLQKNVAVSLQRLIEQGLPAAQVKKILASARPLGDFGYFEKKLDYDTFQDFFSSPVRRYGMDGSIEMAYGASTVPAILGVSPYTAPIDVYMDMNNIPYKQKEDDGNKEMIFYAGHQIEPVYRNYFRYMFKNKYLVFDIDVQFTSRVYPHFIGNCDGWLLDLETGQFGILEIKHTDSLNYRTQMAVQSQNVPAYWDVQERCYMELFDADFSVLCLGWGNRPDDRTMATCRIERDRDLGEDILERAETFVEENVIKRVKPSFHNVKDQELIRRCITEVYGPINFDKPSVEFGESYRPVLKELLTAKESYENMKSQLKEMEGKVKEAEEKYKKLQLPFIEEMKDAPYGYIIDENGDRYLTYYNVRKVVDEDKLKTDYPDVYDECRKTSVDTTKLKKLYKHVYEDVRTPKANVGTFSIKKGR